MRIAVLAGGVGGARFVQALTEVVRPSDVTVIANVGDDLEVHGLHVSPDLDTLLYTLGGLGDEECSAMVRSIGHRMYSYFEPEAIAGDE